MLLREELRILGYDGGEYSEDEFRDIIQEVFAVLHPSWTDEQLLFRPPDGMRFCEAVRCRTSKGLPDELILRTLVNIRKSGRRAKKTAKV